MMVAEHVIRELEVLLADMAFGGLQHVQPVVLDKLEELGRWMTELNMAEGRARIGRLVETLRAYRTDRSRAEQAVSEFCALEFYRTCVLERLARRHTSES